MKDNDFDWYEYYKLANSYSNEGNIAKLRTGMGRFYYSSFFESIDFILESNMFLNHFNEKIMKSSSGRVHQETRFTFKNNEKLNKNNLGTKIAQNLNVLRKYRNMVDYNSKNPRNMTHIYKRCQMKSKKRYLTCLIC
ncbi:hypothetical protein [Methanobrevibacter sp.]|uniref:hypothetical protein n=1 Tax=Methanobrevibacter sp. TaxID=66852 RepID=UPI003863BADD